MHTHTHARRDIEVCGFVEESAFLRLLWSRSLFYACVCLYTRCPLPALSLSLSWLKCRPLWAFAPAKRESYCCGDFSPPCAERVVAVSGKPTNLSTLTSYRARNYPSIESLRELPHTNHHTNHHTHHLWSSATQSLHTGVADIIKHTWCTAGLV